MSKKYHHGNLKEELIYNGLVLLNSQGSEGFSIRKVAGMCGVSHNAPYKHFQSKEELIKAIFTEVWAKFHKVLQEAAQSENKDMGKEYVKFMIQNPEYLKFIFLSDNLSPIKIVDNKIPPVEEGPFSVFQKYAEKQFEDMKLDEKLYMKKTLQMWSVVHGLSILIAKGNIEYDGDVMDLIDILFDADQK